MSRPPPAPPHNGSENAEHHYNASDDSRATLNADVGPSDAVDIAQEERLEILFESDLSRPTRTNERLRTGSSQKTKRTFFGDLDREKRFPAGEDTFPRL